ncbi:zinc metallopeptidase [Cyclobacterium marinum]|uniref:Peptidase membrane zinc metallopeptidase n=1 Tax=Cyclobacterium marinum (strain ATCC 25205 / DSM 745 / LMG 13164 / NCIMB 1802) TaxID=880070 RepID=G0J0V7_CYCMS|nr:zinc metallopeptidase [Cyclobacterium marinum]AEL25083.1 peptidase membrane zinc metallopeptidase [Cyclobacterium marinum DSM 745]MBI0401446.1 zinc metallopeptidase [Cyclobacterium marinum]MBR9776740.1 zinc metallopeptidase [Cytophagales bacterium]|tara:strand:+ start:67220 stop:67912 length:693 start_codon:yes stop_codon:yes gene_type:complete
MGIILIVVVFAILGYVVSNKLKNKFKKYSQVSLKANLSGKEIAELMLADHNIHNVTVNCVEGQLSDHYNPMNKTVNLSTDVYYGRNAAATAVAAHECGHAVQHANSYAWLKLRSALVPIQNISGKILNVVLIASLFGGIALFGLPYEAVGVVVVGAYSMLTLFSVITLPVEFDASNRALAWVKQRNIVTPEEYGMSKDALKWAAMTYVVAALASMATLAYYMFIFFGNRD